MALRAHLKSTVLCSECKVRFIRETRAAKLRLWKDLPRIFNVVSASLKKLVALTTYICGMQVNIAGDNWGSE